VRKAHLAVRFGVLLAVVGCGRPAAAPPPPLRVVADTGGSTTHLTLWAAPHLRINARLAPALELPDGAVLRFGGPRTADSAYFAAPPTAELPRGAALRGRLRASVCREDEEVCRSIILDL
jgi:hypothetical protein